jgi:hypothetical protein
MVPPIPRPIRRNPLAHPCLRIQLRGFQSSTRFEMSGNTTAAAQPLSAADIDLPADDLASLHQSRRRSSRSTPLFRERRLSWRCGVRRHGFDSDAQHVGERSSGDDRDFGGRRDQARRKRCPGRDRLGRTTGDRRRSRSKRDARAKCMRAVHDSLLSIR